MGRQSACRRASYGSARDSATFPPHTLLKPRKRESLGFLTGVKVLLDNGTYRAYYVAWGTEQIPSNSFYLCPNQQGVLIPAVLTLNRATLVSR